MLNSESKSNRKVLRSLLIEKLGRPFSTWLCNGPPDLFFEVPKTGLCIGPRDRFCKAFKGIINGLDKFIEVDGYYGNLLDRVTVLDFGDIKLFRPVHKADPLDALRREITDLLKLVQNAADAMSQMEEIEKNTYMEYYLCYMEKDLEDSPADTSGWHNDILQIELKCVGLCCSYKDVKYYEGVEQYSRPHRVFSFNLNAYEHVKHCKFCQNKGMTYLNVSDELFWRIPNFGPNFYYRMIMGFYTNWHDRWGRDYRADLIFHMKGAPYPSN
ncbi:uncharacterized protein LOC132311282 [Cornus florida]|uniref:uncharacterized protein LOC132311282 n=1 Tax=Cornus florida TaxID=4283 RepID=UPI0028A054BE|nr:uncharacterized protein LOC132311282 [Cornus florida]XP_059665107.1 uncharacterized protein LOC132311282 [Cornus florida]XP_059665108.1 uncharacterized protein LOC132311282 [Cornus florida]XP_059665109.1 uncharacterized protein LOC132311282 [Cornus florida]XP_059665111.1 uncharacterized protein LOC132311282 [Cornus florida]XP_059665112.1 uncharacterized protein LOC132311282 [Cornus florida]